MNFRKDNLFPYAIILTMKHFPQPKPGHVVCNQICLSAHWATIRGEHRKAGRHSRRLRWWGTSVDIYDEVAGWTTEEKFPISKFYIVISPSILAHGLLFIKRISATLNVILYPWLNFTLNKCYFNTIYLHVHTRIYTQTHNERIKLKKRYSIKGPSMYAPVFYLYSIVAIFCCYCYKPYHT